MNAYAKESHGNVNPMSGENRNNQGSGKNYKDWWYSNNLT